MDYNLKKMKNHSITKLAIIIAVITTMILTGCSTTSTNTYRVGTTGLVIEFSKANPVSVYEHEEFGTEMFIKNTGSYNVLSANPGKLRVLYDTYRISSKLGNSTSNVEVPDIALYGKSQYYPIGEEAPVDFYFTSNSLTDLREGAKTTISYNLCYPYTTEFTTMTCMDTTTANKADVASACTTEVYDGQAGQGAPIAITKIEPEILLQQNYIRPQYKIYIENLGGGYVSSMNSCDMSQISGIVGDTNNDYSGKVRVYANLSGDKLDCGADKSGILKLVDSSSFITCYLSSTNENKYSRTSKNYLTPLTVRVEYTYVTLEKQDIEIKRNDALPDTATQDLCDSYQVEYQGRCINKCDYCSNHSTDPMCQDGKPYAGFTFRENFTCKCTLEQCDDKESKGSCIKGYCPGNLYCCSALNCDAWEVEYNGKCIDKCDYCANINSSDSTQCAQNFDFTGFKCEAMTKSICEDNIQKGACILGYCGAGDTSSQPGDQNIRYCANDNKIAAKCPTANDPSKTIMGPKGECMNLCEYCATYGKNGEGDTRCKYQDSSQTINILSDFRCACNATLGTPTKAFIPSDAYCGTSGMYCCATA